jgi:glyoxylase-like metal-dependent hydrolase (beta-lactamase superfamily II)
MHVHHLNCGTMRPASARLVNGTGPLLGAGRLVCHCLLIETAAGLVLVDTGIGLGDIARPRERLGRPFLTAVRPRLDPVETALRQIEQLGFSATDVRHIVVTHLDVDHAGGLGEFPDATVHLLRAEHDAAMRRATLNERQRYVPAQWAHGPRWAIHEPGGDRWNGFESVRCLGEGTEPEVLLVPLFGHTRGHCGVAVREEDGWLLHCGDAYFFHDEVNPVSPRSTPVLSAFQRMVATDDRARRANQGRLRDLARRERGAGLRMFSAHDPVELTRLQQATPARIAAATA